jgi:hypothetical protein
MSKMSASIEELRRAVAAINDAANRLAEIFSGNETVEELPTPDRVPTLEEVRAVLAEKSRMGHTAAIRALLQKYGADRLSGVDTANYKSLLADAEGLGNE